MQCNTWEDNELQIVDTSQLISFVPTLHINVSLIVTAEVSGNTDSPGGWHHPHQAEAPRLILIKIGQTRHRQRLARRGQRSHQAGQCPHLAGGQPVSVARLRRRGGRHHRHHQSQRHPELGAHSNWFVLVHLQFGKNKLIKVVIKLR